MLVAGEARDASIFATLEEYERVTGKTILTFEEAPMMSAMVAAGELPPVAERVGPDVQIVQSPYGTQPYARTLFAVGLSEGIDSVPAQLGWQPIGKTQNTLGSTPNLVKEWTLSKDDTTVTLTLRDGMKWSDGEDFVADDFVFFHDAVLRDERFSPSWQQLLTVDKISDLEVKYSFSTGQVWNPGFLESQPVAPKHYFSEWHGDYNQNAAELAREAGYEDWVAAFKSVIEDPSKGTPDHSPVPGTSPYVLTEPVQGVAIWDRNPYYWKVDATGKQLPYVDRILSGADWSDMPAEVMTGELEFAPQFTLLPSVPLYQRTESGDREYLWDGTAPHPTTIFAFEHVEDDVQIGQLQTDLRFREAISLAINNQELRSLLGFEEPATPGAAGGWVGAEMDYDPGRANQLLDELGLTWDATTERRQLPSGEPIRVILSSPDSYPLYFRHAAELLQDDLAAVGIDLEYYRISEQEWQQKWEDTRAPLGGGEGIFGFGLVDQYRPNRVGGTFAGEGGGGGSGGGSDGIDSGPGVSSGSDRPSDAQDDEIGAVSVGSDTPSDAQDDDMPWPPPKPSDKHVIDRMLLQPESGTVVTLESVNNKLRESLQKAGFKKMYYHRLSDGFVLIPRAEKFDCDTGVYRTDGRWDTQYKKYRVRQGFVAYLKHLFTGAPAGCYRNYAFIVTTTDEFDTVRTDVPFGAEWIDPDLPDLSEHLRKLTFGKTHSAQVFIYVFLRDGFHEPFFMEDYRQVTAVEHLKGSNLSDLVMDGEKQ